MEGAMRKEYDKLREQYPEYISLEQLHQICRIAKRGARYLIANGIIPAIDTGKKTWRYQISIDDVILYLRRREPWGSMIPPGAVSSRPPSSKKPRISFSVIAKHGEENDVYRYFEQLYSGVGDIFTVPEIMMLTGLSNRTILLMLKGGDIKSIGSSPRYIVPKQYLMDFVSSRRFIEIKSHSETFHRLIDGFESWKDTGSIDYRPTACLITE